jgi:integrase
VIDMTQGNEKTTKRKCGPTATGSNIPLADGRWQPRVRLIDGSKMRFDPWPAGTSKEDADKLTLELQERVIREKLRSVRKIQSKARISKSRATATAACADWIKVWHDDRVAHGLTSARDSLAHWETHLKPTLGTKHPLHWTRDDFRALSVELDEKVQRGEVAPKTAVNVWGTATKMADDACNSKLATIRCRIDNPSTDVRGPERGEKIAKQYLFPSEFLQLMQCDKVPVKWRRVVAIAVYTYARAGELRALTWDDVDLERGILSITKATDRTTGGLKSTKTKSPRLLPIEPELLPLLQTMHDECNGEGHVMDLPSERDMSRGLRRTLKRAKIERKSLHNIGPSVRPIRFHDMRATGLTWLAVRGDDPLKIQARAGHTDFSTTQGYIREADILRDGFGQPFPRLPELDQLTGPCGNTSGNIVESSGADGTRTRGLRRDRPAL